MWRARASLEDQVGGLLDHEDRVERRHPPVPAPAHAPGRFPLTAGGSLAIRAARAVDEPEHRQVA